MHMHNCCEFLKSQLNSNLSLSFFLSLFHSFFLVSLFFLSLTSFYSLRPCIPSFLHPSLPLFLSSSDQVNLVWCATRRHGCGTRWAVIGNVSTSTVQVLQACSGLQLPLPRDKTTPINDIVSFP